MNLVVGGKFFCKMQPLIVWKKLFNVFVYTLKKLYQLAFQLWALFIHRNLSPRYYRRVRIHSGELMGGFYGEIQVRKTILLDYESATQPARSVVYWDRWWLDLLYLFIEWFCIATISIFIGETPSPNKCKE